MLREFNIILLAFQRFTSLHQVKLTYLCAFESIAASDINLNSCGTKELQMRLWLFSEEKRTTDKGERGRGP